MTVRLKPLASQIIVITGATSGIGLTTARAACAKGAKLVLAARDSEALDRLAGELRAAGGDALAVPTDVGVHEEVAALGAAAVRRHGRVDFYVLNTDTIRQTIEATTQTMTLLISSIAVISLLVGGIGVMNIMLVSVTERTREIGVRMAVGARQSDIQQQFLIEAVLVCLCGGVLGIGTALLFGALFSHFSSNFTLTFSASSMLWAFLCATAIGIVFGFLPARSAARLNPVDALSRD